MQETWKTRIAPSLGGGFAGTPEEVWGGEEYLARLDQEENCIFFGLYGLPDFYTLWRHKGRKCILWSGSDITNFINGYWLDEKGVIKLDPTPLAKWINKNCENYVENEVEHEALKKAGVESKIVPSFLGNTEDFLISFNPQEKIRLYTSVSGDDFKLYGWDKIYLLAQNNPSVEFHLYGNTTEFPMPEKTLFDNIFIRGKVPQDQMDAETKEMTGALRLTEFDGFSEIVAKSLLWGQYPVSIIKYPHTLEPKNIPFLKNLKEPNIKGRDWLLSVVNKYPWNQK